MAYDKIKYKALINLGVPRTTALGLSDDDSPLKSSGSESPGLGRYGAVGIPCGAVYGEFTETYVWDGLLLARPMRVSNDVTIVSAFLRKAAIEAVGDSWDADSSGALALYDHDPTTGYPGSLVTVVAEWDDLTAFGNVEETLQTNLAEPVDVAAGTYWAVYLFSGTTTLGNSMAFVSTDVGDPLLPVNITNRLPTTHIYADVGATDFPATWPVADTYEEYTGFPGVLLRSGA